MGIDEFIISVPGKGNGVLDRKYRNYITGQLMHLDDDGVDRWEIYNMIIGELVGMGLSGAFEEIKYRLTDGETASMVFSDIIGRVSDGTPILGIMGKKVDLFVEADKYNKFF